MKFKFFNLGDKMFDFINENFIRSSSLNINKKFPTRKIKIQKGEIYPNFYNVKVHYLNFSNYEDNKLSI